MKIKKINNNIEPVIKMIEGESMPLYIFIGATKCPALGNTEMNFMATIIHEIKENSIKVKGRMRYEATGKKTIFEIKEPFKLKDLLEAKRKIQEMYNTICEKIGLIEIIRPKEIEFMQNETNDQIIEKMNKSNLFNINKENLA